MTVNFRSRNSELDFTLSKQSEPAFCEIGDKIDGFSLTTANCYFLFWHEEWETATNGFE
jgi:hypothetical protein